MEHQAVWQGVVLARSADTVVVEGNRYFPPESLNVEYFEHSRTRSLCPWKGLASYYSVTVDGITNRNAAWYYPHPSFLARKIKGRVAFWNGVRVQEVPNTVPTDIKTVPTDLALSTPEGEPTTLSALLHHRLTVVQLVRYFGCLPCQEWLTALDDAAPRLAEHDIAVAAIGGSADYQAQWLRDERGVAMPLYLDPSQGFRDAVGAGKPLGMRMLNPKGAAAYARSMRNGFRPQKITRDTLRSPGVVILDRYGNVCWQHIGTRIGDYPPLQVVERAATQLALMTS